MKHIVSLIGIALLIVALAACGGSSGQPAATPTNVPAPASAASTPTASSPSQLVDDPNTVKTASGLKYVDQAVGTGATPASSDWVTIQFTATLQDGTVIAASRTRGGPTQFPIDQVAQEVPGWAEGMSTMKVGGSRKLIIPPNLAYGDTGAGNGVIPPNATLVFYIDLIDTKPAPKVKIEDIAVGTGPEATAGMTITVNYTGTLTDGTVFDSSYKRQEPFTLTLGVGQVIPGWDQGLEGMKVGGKRTLTIPPELAYGSQGAGSTIPPNATLIFQVELLSAVK